MPCSPQDYVIDRDGRSGVTVGASGYLLYAFVTVRIWRLSRCVSQPKYNQVDDVAI